MTATKPTDIEMRIAIAEACGWRWDDGNGDYVVGWMAPDGLDNRQLHERLNGVVTKEDYPHLLPDYLNSLDAMHEAEETLTAAQKEQFANALYKLSDCYLKTCQEDHEWDELFILIHATARQRAEAFLRVVKPELFA